MIRAHLSFSVVALLSIVGCSNADSGVETEEPSAESALSTERVSGESLPVVVLGEEDKNATVNVIEGQRIMIRLKDNPSAGFRWRVTRNGRLAEPSADSERIGPRGAVGAPRHAVFTWETDGKVGSHEIALKKSRGANGQAMDAIAFKVVVTDADPELECPNRAVVSCKPPLRTASKKKTCAAEYRAWAEANCDTEFKD